MDFQTIQTVVNRCNRHIKFAYLFGSYASGDISESSDIDIAVYVTENDAERCFDLKLELYAEWSRALKRNDIDIVVMNQCKNLILLDCITRYGIVLIDTDESFREVYEQKILHYAIEFKHRRKRVMGV
jgi:predicted nucleotidyltransferase